MSVEPKPRPLDHLWTTAQVVGVVVTLTGFTPDRWMTYFLDAVKLPDSLRDSLFAGFDVRFIAVGVGVAIIAADAIFRNRRRRQQQIPAGTVQPVASLAAVSPLPTEPPAAAMSPLMGEIEPIKDKPSIAVLPFVNMSDDKSQEYFADGMTEDIITGLSCDNRLFVIARNSTFAYKGQSPDIRAVGKELGVRYVLEGSIRPVGDRLRITVQLIETVSGAHVWADKIDRPVAEIFDIMDDVVDGLVTTLCSNLGIAEAKRASRQRPEDLQAWALCVQAEAYALQPGAEALDAEERLARQASEIEPGYGISWALLAAVTSMKLFAGVVFTGIDAGKSREEVLALANKALSLAPQDPVVLGQCGRAFIWSGQTERAIDCLEHSLELNPNSGRFRLLYGLALWADGRPEAGIAQLDQFLRVSPKDPHAGLAYLYYSQCYLALDDFQRAETAARTAVKRLPGFLMGHVCLALSLISLGRADEARQVIRSARLLVPGMTRQNTVDRWRLVIRKPEQSEKRIALINQLWDDLDAAE
ncbi:MAG: tetratricopeptide repeat protein [Porticoccaceae bacterium]